MITFEVHINNKDDWAICNEIQSWLKLAAFVKRNRDIKLGGDN